MGNRRSRADLPKSRKPGHRRQRKFSNTAQTRAKVFKYSSVTVNILNKSAELSDIIEQIPLPPVKVRVRHAKILVGKQKCLAEATTWDGCKFVCLFLKF
jgi:hypothetical protein